MRSDGLAMAMLACAAMATSAAAQGPTYTAEQLSALPGAPRPVAVQVYEDIKHNGYGAVAFGPALNHPFVSITTTLTVPPSPPPAGTLFLWPGIGPGPKSAHFLPRGNGILQPVLTWGWGCVSQERPRHHESWWISGQYVTNHGRECYGGDVMVVQVGDVLDMAIWQAGPVWKQKVTDRRTGRSVTFDQPMGDQEQVWGYLTIETKDQPPTIPIVFRNTVLRWSGPSPFMCYPARMGRTDTMTVPVLSADKTSCTIDTVILRDGGMGVRQGR
jgi:hypothetical protein